MVDLLAADIDRYTNHLHHGAEGYIQLIQFKNGRVLKMYNEPYKNVCKIAYKNKGQKDFYITPNTFYKPYRANENIRHFRSLYIDVDLNVYSKIEAVYQVFLIAEKGEIPRPTMIVDSGQGIHLYWRIKDAPVGATYTWQELEDYLYSKLKYLGADIKATDAARFLRLPETINSRNNKVCMILYINDEIIYSMYDLREKYLNYIKKNKSYKKPKKAHKTSQNKKNNVLHLFNTYSLYMARISDLLTLCRLRNYEVTGYRNMIMHCYIFWKAIYVRNIEHLKKLAYDLNNKFSESQRVLSKQK